MRFAIWYQFYNLKIVKNNVTKSNVTFSKVAGFAQSISFRNSHSQVFSRKVTLKKFTKFTGKYLRWRLVTQ